MQATLTPPRVGALLGLALAALDLALLLLLGLRIEAGGLDFTVPILGCYGATFAVLGWVIGKLIVARGRARRDAAVIRAQVEALRASQVRLVQAEKLASLGRMAAGVAHEVRNPLGVIRSSAGLAQEDLPVDATDAREALGFIVDEVDRLDDFVRRILDFSRPIAPRAAPTPLDAVLDRALRLGEEHLAGVTVRREGEPASVPADAELLTRLVLGLLVNAAQAGASTVTLRAGATDAGAFVEVADDGPGIDATVRDQLFEPFVTSKPDGTGLGLALGRRIAEAHGGTLRLAGEGPGARLRLELPAGPGGLR